MRQSNPKLERSPSTLSSASLRELRRRASVDSMAGEDTDSAQNLEYEVTLVSTRTYFPASMSENVVISVVLLCCCGGLSRVLCVGCLMGGVWPGVWREGGLTTVTGDELIQVS